MRALALLFDGVTVSDVARHLGVPRSTVSMWWHRPSASHTPQCPRCDGGEQDSAAYAALLGYYLGDGCLSRVRRTFALRISCDATYTGTIEDIDALLLAVHPHRPVFHVLAPGVVVVQQHWKHWPCLFPQHRQGRKHTRPIVLEDWQRRIVEEHPAAFLRGLFHSDGCRANNWTRRRVAGEWKRYDYPRWQFSNRSDDIRALCGWALDLVDVPWRQSNQWTISVSTRAGVSRLDELIGLKS